MENFTKKLYQTLELITPFLSTNPFPEQKFALNIKGRKSDVFKIKADSITLLDQPLTRNFFQRTSTLTDAWIDEKQLTKFLQFLQKASASFLLNHVGFCYQVKSQTKEQNRLSKIAGGLKTNIYSAPSNDLALWLFIGEKNNHQQPMLEFLPVKKAEDYFADYWLPHIHLDLFTTLTSNQIKYTTHNILKGSRTANPTVVFDNIIYQQRVWLGVVDGININLDLSNNTCRSLEERRKAMSLV